MKRFQKIYLEISNICNLNCSFCPGTTRHPHTLSEEEFRILLPKLQPYTDYLYFHLMGEPLIHPKLNTFLSLAGEAGLKVILTTNGTLLASHQDTLLHAPALHKVNVSLHSFEANAKNVDFEKYLADCFAFGCSAEGKKLVVYRLWNNGGSNDRNEEILSVMKRFFPGNWVSERRGIRIGNRVFLEYGDKFDWPDLHASRREGRFFCYGLRDQLGVLCDGTVVPCCLDHEGDIALGNLFCEDLYSILSSPRASALYNGFSQGIASEELCHRCGYAGRFQ